MPGAEQPFPEMAKPVHDGKYCLLPACACLPGEDPNGDGSIEPVERPA